MSTSTDRNRAISELVEEREYLLRSIEDLEREHAAGDVDDEDYTKLRTRYVRRAAATLRALEAAEEVGSDEPPGRERRLTWQAVRRFCGRRRPRRVMVAVTIVCAVGALSIVAADLAGVRLPGQSLSGSISLPTAAEVQGELTAAQELASAGNLSGALAAYQTVLKQVPGQPEALAYEGWLERLAGVAKANAATVRAGDASIAQAIRVAPKYSDARAFEVIVLLEDDHAPSKALTEYAAFQATKPSTILMAAIGPQMALAFHLEHVGLPSALARYAS